MSKSRPNLFHQTEAQEETLQALVDHEVALGVNTGTKSALIQRAIALYSRIAYPDRADLWYPAPDGLPFYDRKKFAQQFKHRLKIKGLTQNKLCDKLLSEGVEVNQKYLSERFREEPLFNPGVTEFWAVVKILGINWEDIAADNAPVFPVDLEDTGEPGNDVSRVA